ncbi:MAG: NAD-dependent epimerase/dehydratase family protein [Bacteroidales bacterium]|nr:NAD-dependent epimerase/dehydratase family protein [Bacteroidales bacterium]
MKVLLLGANGMLGRNVIDALLAHGDQVVAAVRAIPQNWPSADGLSTCVVPSLDLRSLKQAATGCDAVINCAGCTNMGLLRLDDYLPANRDLCATLLQLMMQSPLRALVHISTANTVGNGTADHPGTEANTEPQPPFSHSLYVQSKLQGERLLLRGAEGLKDRHIVVLNPGFMIGPHDLRPSSGQMVDAAWRRPLMVAPRGGKSFVATTDVAQAAVSALTQGRSGQRYLLTGSNLSLGQFYALCAATGHYKQRLVALPNRVVRAAGRLGDLLRRLGIATQLSSANTELLIAAEHYSSAKAQAELGFCPTPIATAIAQYKNL